MIVVALSCSRGDSKERVPTIAVAINGRLITIWGAIQKEVKNHYTKALQKISREVISNNFCYCKVGRAITKWGSHGKSPILRKKNNLIVHQKLF